MLWLNLLQVKFINLPREYNFQNKHAPPPPPARNDNIVPATMYDVCNIKVSNPQR